MTQNIKNNMSSSCWTRRSENKDFMCLMDPRVKPEDDRRGVRPRVGDDRRTESGRSMTEMLGVLAVVGVLSVGAIAGYRYAMDKYYTNEILAGASQRAVLVAAQIAAGQTPSLTEFRKMNDTAGGTFAGTVNTDTAGEFGIQVSGVKESVCENLVKATEDTDIILVKTDGSDLTESDCSGDENTFMFVYSNDMSSTDITPAKPTYESCVAEGRCTYDRGKYHCLNGAVNPPYCTEDCLIGCHKEGYTCFGSDGCSCRYEGTYPNCNSKPACIDDGTCRCEQVSMESFGCYCSYGGTYPNCNIKPDCITAGLCQCDIDYWGGSCSCTYDVGTYPNCSKPACLDKGTCPDNYCIYGGTYPDCNDKPTCLDKVTCACIDGCMCLYGGTYPNNCNAKPACIDDGICVCNYPSGYCHCKYAADDSGKDNYPNCPDKPACLDKGTCSCSNGSCSCTYDVGTYPNCSKPDCIDKGTCSCSNGSCSCTYDVGTYPNCSKPDCIDKGTCSETSIKGKFYCRYGGTYPDNCIDKPACIDNKTCLCDAVSGECFCRYDGTYPNCNPAS